VFTTEQRSFDAVIEKVDKATATVHADMPDGAVTVRVPSVIAIRAALGSKDPAAIFLPTLAGTFCHTIEAVVICKVLQRFFVEKNAADTPVEAPAPRLLKYVPLVLATSGFIAFGAAAYTYKTAVTSWIIPGLIAGVLTLGVVRRVKVYEVFIEAAKDGFSTAMRIVPFVVGIQRSRPAALAGIFTDIFGVIMAVLLVRFFLGS
jgi:hypothetical protein